MAYRSWMLTSDDEVEDDVGDRAIARDTADVEQPTEDPRGPARP
jgi:hypothetical protein